MIWLSELWDQVEFKYIVWKLNTLSDSESLVCHHNVSWNQLVQEATVLSYKLIWKLNSPCFRHKWNRTLWCYPYQNFDCIVMFVTGKCLCPGQQVWRPLDKYFKAIDHNSCFLSECTLEALGIVLHSWSLSGQYTKRSNLMSIATIQWENTLELLTLKQQTGMQDPARVHLVLVS